MPAPASNDVTKIAPTEQLLLDLAHKLAAGETLQLEELALIDQKLARGLTRLSLLRGAMQPETASRWGHLLDLQPAGQGSFGEVFRAFDPTLDRSVALKLRRSDLNLIHSGRDFIAEAQRMARVRHPHVLAVHGASYHDARAGIWSDWIDGETLHAQLLRESKLAYPRWLALAVELASALSAVHQQNIVHADIKASNVMIDRAGHSILMDFGAGFEQSPEARALAGTPGYLAPEVLAGAPANQAIDIYALGVLLHLALCAHKPIAMQVSALVQPKAVRRLLASMLAEQPNKRPSAMQVVNELRVIHTLPLTRAKQRNRWLLVAALGMVSLVSSIGYWVSARERARAVQARDYLVEVLRFSNPYQSDKPTQQVQDLYKNAVALVPARLANDPQTQAELLNQFGRSLLMLDQEEAALQALKQAQAALERRGVAIAEPLYASVRTNLVDTYARLRQFDAALALRADDLQACTSLNTRVASATHATQAYQHCINVLNSYGENLYLAGQFSLAQSQLARARKLSLNTAIEQTYVAAYTIYLQGLIARELGRNDQAFMNFTELTERTLRVVPGTHPGLATDMFLMAGVASELGNRELALALNASAVKARSSLFGPDARLSIHTRLQQAVLAVKRNDRGQAVNYLRALRSDLPTTKSFQNHREDVAIWLAIADATEITELELLSLEGARLQIYGATNLRSIEFQIRLAWAWLARGNTWAAKKSLRTAEAALPALERDAIAPMLLLLQSELAARDGDALAQRQLRARCEQALALNQRVLWQPLTGERIGLQPDTDGRMRAKLEQLHAQVLARRKSVNAPGS